MTFTEAAAGTISAAAAAAARLALRQLSTEAPTANRIVVAASTNGGHTASASTTSPGPRTLPCEVLVIRPQPAAAPPVPALSGR